MLRDGLNLQLGCRPLPTHPVATVCMEWISAAVGFSKKSRYDTGVSCTNLMFSCLVVRPVLAGLVVGLRRTLAGHRAKGNAAGSNCPCIYYGCGSVSWQLSPAPLLETA